MVKAVTIPQADQNFKGDFFLTIKHIRSSEQLNINQLFSRAYRGPFQPVIPHALNLFY